MRVVLSCLLVVALGIVPGCATPSKKLIEIRLGMNKSDVWRVLGEPTVVRGSIRNKFGQVIEVWQYRLALPSSDSAGQVVGKTMFTLITFGVGAAAFAGEKRDYWLYFLHDELVQWGEAGDWSREPDRIYEFNFEPRPTMPR